MLNGHRSTTFGVVSFTVPCPCSSHHQLRACGIVPSVVSTILAFGEEAVYDVVFPSISGTGCHRTIISNQTINF